MQNTYSIQDLCDQTGLPRRTIHFYTQQGLIPPPEGAGLGAYYTDTHLLRLKAIPVLRIQGLRLDQIRSRIAELSDSALADLAQAASHKTSPAQTVSANLFSQYVLGAGITINAPQRLSPADRRKLDLLLKEARRIFQTPMD